MRTLWTGFSSAASQSPQPMSNDPAGMNAYVTPSLLLVRISPGLGPVGGGGAFGLVTSRTACITLSDALAAFSSGTRPSDQASATPQARIRYSARAGV